MLLHPARLSRHCATVAVLACAALLLGGTSGHADSAPRPESFGGDATASSFHYLIDRRPQPTPVSDAFHVEVPYVTTAFDSSGTASATSSTFFPGAGPLGVPALLCQFAAPLCQPPFPAVPGYPLIARASYPTQPDAQADLSPGPQSLGPFTISPNVIAAHADQDRVEATAGAAGVDLPGQLSAGGATTRSKQSFEGGTLVAVAESTVTGLDLLGGMLHIGALTSIATARADGANVTAASATTTVTGATLSGQAVTIDSTGIHLAGNGDDGAALKQLNGALASLEGQGIGVRLLSSTKQVSGRTASAIAGGLLVSFDQDINLPGVPVPLPPKLPGVPAYNGTYFGSVTVGGAGARAFATPAEDVTLPPVDVSTDRNLGSPIVHAAPLGTGQALPPSLSPRGTGPAVAVPNQVAPHTRRAAVLGVDLSADRLTLLCLVLLGYPLLVLAGTPIREGREWSSRRRRRS